ncbi:MAG: hypothetical protein HXX13_01770 [Bacteroidetes bacterium]|nr:hypothetical protein [Bacteroidota bacterium]
MKLDRTWMTKCPDSVKSGRLFHSFIFKVFPASGVIIAIIVFIFVDKSVGQVTSLYSQNFGAVITFPTGWSAASSSTWTVSNTNSSTPTPTFSGNSNLASGSSSNARVVTYSNNLSTVGYTSITVLWAARRTYSNNLTFEWSADGTNWNTLAVTDVAANSTWAWVNGGTRISLPAGASGATNLSFRWTYDSDGTGGVYRIDDFTVEGCKVPNQPSAVAGSATPCSGTSQVYSVTNVAGVTYTWSFPAGWTQTGGGTTNSVTVTVGATSGNVQVTPSNVCGNGTASILAVTVNSVPAQPSVISGLASPCQGSSQTYSVTNVAGVTYTWVLPTGWTQTGGGTTNSITVTVGANSGNITVTPSNACGNGTSRQLAVLPVAAVPAQPSAITGSTTPCSGSSQTYSLTNIVGVTYTWVVPAGWTIVSGQGTNSISVTCGATSGNITVTPSNTCGNGTARSLAIIVMTIPAQPSVITGNANPCSGSSQTYSVTNVAGTTYTWTFPAGWTQTAGGTTNSVTVTVGANAGTIQVMPSNACGNGTSSTIAVTISTVPAQPSVITGLSSPCQGSSQTYSVTNVSGVTYNWALPAGWIQTGGGTTNSITVTVGASSGNITVTPSNACGNGTARQLAVTPVASVPAQPSSITGSATPCLGSTQAYTIINVAGLTYTWVVPGGTSIVSGQGTNSITVTIGANSGNITVTPSNICGNGSAQVLAISVLTIPGQPSAISGTANACSGTTQTYSVTNLPGTTYTWSFPADWVITSGQGTNTVNVTIGNLAGNVQVVPSNACGTGPAQSLAVNVITVPAQPSAINGNTLICKNSVQNFSVTNVSGVTYTWTVPTGWSITSGQGTNSITTTSGVTSGNVTVVPSNSCGNGTSQILAVTVQTSSPAQPSVITGNVAPCAGTSVVYSVVNVANVIYSWTVPAGWTITAGQGTNSITVIVGAGSGIVTVSPSNYCGGGASQTLAVASQAATPLQPSAIIGSSAACAGTGQVYSVTNTTNVTYTWTVPSDWTILSGQGTNSISVTIGSSSGNVVVVPSNSCGNGPSSTLAVTVVTSAPLQPSVISGNDTICESSTKVYSVINVAGVTYTWSLPVGWTISSGQGTNSINVIPGSTSGTIQVIPSNACGNGPSRSKAIIVKALPLQPGIISGNTTVCQNSPQTYSIIAVSGISYNWSIPASWTLVAGQGTNSIMVTIGTTSGSITVTPSNSCGNGPATTKAITVNPSPAAYTGPNAIICVGASFQIGGPAIPGNTYSWTSIPAGFTSTLSNPIVTPAVNTTYQLVETNPATGCSSTNFTIVTTNQVITVTVNPVTQMETICSGTATNITLTSNISNTSFSWTAALVSGSSTTFTGSGTGNSINQVITNTSAAPSQVKYLVIASADECTNTSTSILVTINPVPLVNSQTVSVCSNIALGLNLGASTNGVAVASYSITSINSNGLIASAGNPVTGAGLASTVLADDAWTNATMAPLNVVYTISPVSTTGCAGTSFTVTATINPKPVVTNLSSYEICSGSGTGITLSSNIPSTYSWTLGTITGGITGAAAGTGSTLNQVLTNPSTSADGSVNYIVTPTASSGGCVGSPYTITVIVHPKPVVTNAATASICNGTAFGAALSSSVPCNFSWSVGTITGGVTGASAGTGSTINQTLSIPGNSIAGTVQYLITPTSISNACVGTPFTLTVTVNPTPAVSASSSVASVCPGTNFNLFSSCSNVASPTLMNETFNGANSWTTTSTSTGGTTANAAWTMRNDGYVTNGVTIHSNDASRFYLSDSRAQNGTVTATTLVSPVLSTVGYSNLSLSFWHFFDFNSTTGEYAKVEVSTNNGSSWTTVATYTSDRGSGAGFQNEVINLGASYINSSAFLLRFNYYCGSNRGRYWAIDNVDLTGTPVSTPSVSWTSNPAGFTSNVANPTNVTQTVTTAYTAVYTDLTTTCSGSSTTTVTSFPVPNPTITANYCLVPGKIHLTASAGTSYLWNTGETTQSIDVDVAGVYSVVVTNASGCSSTAYLSVSNELVVNGDFSAGNSGFSSGYSYDPTANGLIAPESEYAVNNNANYNHPNFWGYDHTSGTGTGNANFLIVNGAKYAPQPFVWKETVTVVPNKDYYFSAWAISLNNVAPFAELRFSVNGVQVGTTATLTAGQNILNNPWLLKDRFYGTWNSGATTTAVIEILDLNTSANGNDFGLDDISFGTLAQIPFTMDPYCSPASCCTGQSVQLFANINGGRPPITYHWTGPNGFNSTLQDPVLNNLTVAGSGKYFLTVSDGYGCTPVVDSVTVTVLPLPTANVTGPASVCQFSPSPQVTFTGSGGTAPYTFTYKINGGSNLTLTTTSGNSATLNIPTTTPGDIIYTLVSVNSAANCSQLQSGSLTVHVYALPSCIISGPASVCPSATGLAFSGNAGMTTYSWSISGSGSISGSASLQNVSVTSGASCNGSFQLDLSTTDSHGCTSVCEETVLVKDDVFPLISCPPNQTIPADAGLTYATVTLPAPVYSDNCTATGSITVSWVMTAPTAGSGNGPVPAGFHFNVGTTQVTYTVTDACGHATNCSFNVIVTPNNPPVITCPTNIILNTQAGVCTASANPGIPTITGGTGVTLSWVMTGATLGSGNGAIVPNPYTFNLGVTTITWTATNIAGTVTCIQTVTVIDNQPPNFTPPVDQAFCVINIINATYYDPTMDITPARPEYYILTPADKIALSPDPATFTDNCTPSGSLILHWRLDFNGGNPAPLTGIGLLSAYTNEIRLAGDVTNNVQHTLTYWLEDASGNLSASKVVTITIRPRPNIIKL